MTKIRTAFVITIIIFTLAFAEYKITKDTFSDVSKIIEQTEISAKNRSDDTDRLCGEIEDEWNKRQYLLEIFQSHGEMDKVDISIENLKRLSEENNFDRIYLECGVLRNNIKSLADDEEIKLYNFF